MPDKTLSDTKRHYYKANTIARQLDVHPSTVWRWAEQGRIAKPIKLSAGVTRWRAADVEDLFEETGGVS